MANHETRVCNRCRNAYSELDKYVCGTCRAYIDEKNHRDKQTRKTYYAKNAELIRHKRRQYGRRKAQEAKSLRIAMDAPSRQELASARYEQMRVWAEKHGRIPCIREVASLFNIQYQTAAYNRRKAFGLDFRKGDTNAWSKKMETK